jgi:hypothetical protein
LHQIGQFATFTLEKIEFAVDHLLAKQTLPQTFSRVMLDFLIFGMRLNPFLLHFDFFPDLRWNLILFPDL